MIDTIYTDREIAAEHFNGYDPSQYVGSIEEAREELAYWVEQGWATAEPTADNTVEITAEDMQAAIYRHLLAPVTITTLDPHTWGIVTNRAGVEIDTVRFDFYSEDRAEWERRADERLHEAGYRRVGAWRDDGSAAIATLERV
ncbi:hypothetical protein [Dokdonella sp.]|uniref:hypothetical protein n=1 Tax=Dokdonella sp. TaxID=2291710 RepID=UPI0031C2B063|nr:hypothetical protein [Dokdonella sp.]